MITTRDRNKLIDKINTVFRSIGNTNGTSMPATTSNNALAAWDLFIAQHLAALAGKRKEQAEAGAIVAGVIIDKDKDPREPGTRERIYTSDVVDVLLDVRHPSKRVDVDKVVEYLANHGVKQSLLDEALWGATKMTKPAHVFTTILNHE